MVKGIQQGLRSRGEESHSPNLSRKEFSSEPQTPFIKSLPIRKESLSSLVSESKLNPANMRAFPAREQLFKVEEEIQLLVSKTTDGSTKSSTFIKQRLEDSLKDIKQLRESMKNDGTWGNFLRCLRPKKTLQNMTAVSEVQKSEPIDAIPLNAFALNNLKLQSKMLETAVESKILEIQKKKIRVMRVANQHRRTQSGCCMRESSRSEETGEPGLDSHRQFREYSEQKQAIYSGLAGIRSQLRTIRVSKGVQPRWEEKQTLRAAGRPQHTSMGSLSPVMRDGTSAQPHSACKTADGRRRLPTPAMSGLRRPLSLSGLSPRTTH